LEDDMKSFLIAICLSLYVSTINAQHVKPAKKVINTKKASLLKNVSIETSISTGRDRSVRLPRVRLLITDAMIAEGTGSTEWLKAHLIKDVFSDHEGMIYLRLKKGIYYLAGTHRTLENQDYVIDHRFEVGEDGGEIRVVARNKDEWYPNVAIELNYSMGNATVPVGEGFKVEIYREDGDPLTHGEKVTATDEKGVAYALLRNGKYRVKVFQRLRDGSHYIVDKSFTVLGSDNLITLEGVVLKH
jgi:hypothetical protein